MFLRDSYVTIDATIFTGNRAGQTVPRGNASYYFALAGVIYYERSHINITNSNFFNNSASIGELSFLYMAHCILKIQLSVIIQLNMEEWSIQITAISLASSTVIKQPNKVEWLTLGACAARVTVVCLFVYVCLSTLFSPLDRFKWYFKVMYQWMLKERIM